MKHLGIRILGALLSAGLLTGCFGSGSSELSVMTEKDYELGDQVILSPEQFLLETPEDEVLEAIELESELTTSSSYNYTGFTHEVVSAGKRALMPGSYLVTLKSGNRKYDVILNVKDTTAPDFISAPRKMIVKQGDIEFDLPSRFRASDLDEVTITSEGSYDINTPGSYPVTIVATDASGNRNELPITLQVIGENEYIDISDPSDDLLVVDPEQDAVQEPVEETPEENTEPAPEDSTTQTPNQPACSVSGAPAGASLFTSFEEMIAVGTEWNTQNPYNYFYYAIGKDDCGNTVYMLTMGTATEDNPFNGADFGLEGNSDQSTETTTESKTE